MGILDQSGILAAQPSKFGRGMGRNVDESICRFNLACAKVFGQDLAGPPRKANRN